MRSSWGYFPSKGRNTLFIVLTKVPGALHSLKLMTVGSYCPSGVVNAALCQSSSLIRMLLYPIRMSNLVNSCFPWSCLISSEIKGKGWRSGTVYLLSCW
jgi:hypothetical protein